MRFPFTLLILVALAALAIVGCQPQEPVDGIMTIYINGDVGPNSYFPAKTTVPSGTVVVWVNADTKPHTVSATLSATGEDSQGVEGGFDSGPIPPNGGRWSFGAEMPGTYNYGCRLHPKMNGTLVVVQATEQPVVGH